LSKCEAEKLTRFREYSGEEKNIFLAYIFLLTKKLDIWIKFDRTSTSGIFDSWGNKIIKIKYIL